MGVWGPFGPHPCLLNPIPRGTLRGVLRGFALLNRQRLPRLSMPPLNRLRLALREPVP